MKLLVHVALAPARPKIYARTIQTLFNAEYDDPLEILFAREDKPIEGHKHNLTAKHNRVRTLALRGDYDAVLFVENDMVLPPDAINKMVAAAKDAHVVYGLYCNRHGKHQWLCATLLEDTDAKWLSDDPERAKALWGEIIPSKGAGFGCTLVRREVLERIPFRIERGHPGVSDDWWFALDVERAGFRQMHHLGVVCGHVATTKGTPRIVWPDPDAHMLHSVELFDKAKQLRPLPPNEPIKLTANEMGVVEVFRENGNGVHDNG